MPNKKTVIVLLSILAIAGFLRFWKLESFPPGVYPDEAINGNQALLEPGKVFYPENNGREGLFINLTSLSFKIFGPSIFSFRLVPALIGTLTVLGTYLLTNELFRGLGSKVYSPRYRKLALLASFLLAVSFWHINFSRISFRAILVPFLMVFSFYFLLKGLKNNLTNQEPVKYCQFTNFILAGIFFGLGFYTYIAFRMAVLLLPIVFILWWLIYRKEKREKQFLLSAICYLLFATIVTLPIGIYFLRNPADFLGRTSLISIFAADNPIKELGKSLILHLGMFNFYGDPNWRHNFSGQPQFFFPVGILFLFGFFLSVKEILRAFKEKNLPLFSSFILIISWFFIMLLPGILTREGLPHALRVIGVIPACYIFAGLGGIKTYEFLKKNSGRRKMLILASILFLAALFSHQTNKYFYEWGENPEVSGAFSKDLVEVGKRLNSFPQETKKYVIVNMEGVLVGGIPMPAQTVMLMENLNQKNSLSAYLLPQDVNQIKIEKTGVIVLMDFDSEILVNLSRKFPEAEIYKVGNSWLFDINNN